MEQKKKPERALSNSGCHVFNGTLTLTIKGKEYKVRCEYHGLDLQRASQEHQLIVLIKQHLPYDEVDTGWLVRTKEMDKEHRFGLKARKNDRLWSVYDYNDVVAWGYADGGLNSTHFDSCRLRPEECPQFAGHDDDEKAVMSWDDDEWEDLEYTSDTPRRSVRFRIKNGEIHYHAAVAADEEMERGGTEMMHDAAKVFDDFRKQHPEVTEMHFYTDEKLQVNE